MKKKLINKIQSTDNEKILEEVLPNAGSQHKRSR